MLLQQVVCSFCGKEFEKKPSHIAASGKTYCSKHCHDLGKLRGEYRQCLRCNAEFYARSREITEGMGKYCSKACADAERREIRVCPQCHKEFVIIKSAIKQGGGKHCSQACRIAHDKASLFTRQCPYCQKDFTIYGHQRKDKAQRFCSMECYKAWRIGKNKAGEAVCRVSHCRNPHYQEGLCEQHYRRGTFINGEHPAPEYALAYKFKERMPYGSGRAPQATREWRQRYKLDVMAYYCKGKPCCMRCGFDDLRALCIDHIYHDGAEHRQAMTQKTGRRAAIGSSIYIWLKKQQYPEGFQVLCANCNMIKEAEYREENPERSVKKRLRTPNHGDD